MVTGRPCADDRPLEGDVNLMTSAPPAPAAVLNTDVTSATRSPVAQRPSSSAPGSSLAASFTTGSSVCKATRGPRSYLLN